MPFERSKSPFHCVSRSPVRSIFTSSRRLAFFSVFSSAFASLPDDSDSAGISASGSGLIAACGDDGAAFNVAGFGGAAFFAAATWAGAVGWLEVSAALADFAFFSTLTADPAAGPAAGAAGLAADLTAEAVAAAGFGFTEGAAALAGGLAIGFVDFAGFVFFALTALGALLAAEGADFAEFLGAGVFFAALDEAADEDFGADFVFFAISTPLAKP